MRVLRDSEIVAAVLLASAIAAAYYYYATVNGIDSGLRDALSNVPVINSAGSSDTSDDGTGPALTWLGEWL
jgi:hypothetical protein